jgi:hypothetical protein
MKYSDKLKDPRWQKKRLEILERDKWTCKGCNDTETTLHVHHTIYHPNIEPWDYPEKQLITLCEDCHTFEREGRKEYENDLLRLLKFEGVVADEVFGLMNALMKISKVMTLTDFIRELDGRK